MGVSLVSAPRGGGKTSFLREYVTRAVRRGRSVGGVVSPAVFHNGRHIGYDVIDLRDGTGRALARRATSAGRTPDVGMYTFDGAAVAEGNAAIVAAVRDRLEVIAIDEVGPLEFGGRGWAPALRIAVEECSLQQELIVTVRLSLVDELPNRFASRVWENASRISPPWPASMLA